MFLGKSSHKTVTVVESNGVESLNELHLVCLNAILVTEQGTSQDRAGLLYQIVHSLLVLELRCYCPSSPLNRYGLQTIILDTVLYPVVVCELVHDPRC